MAHCVEHQHQDGPDVSAFGRKRKRPLHWEEDASDFEFNEAQRKRHTSLPDVSPGGHLAAESCDQDDWPGDPDDACFVSVGTLSQPLGPGLPPSSDQNLLLDIAR